ncbi:DUF2207 domain-containing protein [Candidatus Parcubacteria bacterium]|nr:DUF2207 domain-containing protein [Candidatus Parcubacteria bacterium]
MKKIVGVFLLTLSVFLPTVGLASHGEKSYSYDSITYDIQVNVDSTFDVTETEVFDLHGQFNAAERYIPFKDISGITNISVRDGETGRPLMYSPHQLDKLDSSSWGKYTFYKKNGSEYIEWYYNAKDTKKTWIVSYKIHGGISFLKDHDELYWNLFQDYSVPIGVVSARVTIPEHSYDTSHLQTSVYTKPDHLAAKNIFDSRTFTYEAENVPPEGIITIAAGWPKDIVSEAAYWKDFLKTYIPIIIAIFIVISSVVTGILYWYFTEKHNKGRGTIVPEYDPPQNLRPAMAEALVKEGISNKAWPATIVDLAVRGYIKIIEEEPNWANKIAQLFMIPSKDYIIEQIKDPSSDPHLEEYEKTFLGILGPRFSTREMKNSGKSKKREMYKAMQELKKELYKETELDTKAYTVPLSHAKYISYGIVALIIIFWISSSLHVIALGISVFSIGLLMLFMKFNPRLSAEGAIMREQWLGFKLYLETAERYRMQNLTPEIFEKYLPYAMIFGIEKKWAQAFESIHMAPPTWYAGAAYYHTSVGAGTTSGFSPSVFSSSFATSLASAFSSAGGGASGGGGSAGGGGGGGGGGAS